MYLPCHYGVQIAQIGSRVRSSYSFRNIAAARALPPEKKNRLLEGLKSCVSINKFNSLVVREETISNYCGFLVKEKKESLL